MNIERYEPSWYWKEMQERAEGRFVNYKSHQAIVASLTNQLNAVFNQLQAEQEKNRKLIEALLG